MNRFSVLLAGAALAVTTAGAASAATVYATGFNDVVAGTGAGAPGRDDPASALDAPDALFYSLGLGGSIDLTFGQTFNVSNVTTYEVTFGNVAEHPEQVSLYALLGDTVVGLIGSVGNLTATSGAGLTFSGMFDGIRVVDTTPASSPSEDGFDLNALGITPVPLPAAGLLLAGGLAGLGLLRRKRA